jgi:misacylated tRNA(Ala) deacylase
VILITQLLYLDDSYQKEFKATITNVDNKFITLDKTLFYPNSGGQPTDIGTISKDDNDNNDNIEFKVVFAKKQGADVVLELETEDHNLKEGDSIKGIIDWNIRHKYMRYHTASHVISYVVYKETGALITGNQLGLEKSRVDFNLENFDREKIKEYEQKANNILKQNLEVSCEGMPREEAFKIPSVLKLKNVLPPSIDIIRIVKIGDLDAQACGGTHVKNTQEIGQIEIIKAENKGKDNRRIVFKLK